MAEIEEKINTENKRDYDKNPIVIEDYIPRIIFYVILSELIFWELLFIINPIGINNSEVLRILLCLPIIILPTFFEYRQNKSKSYILKNNTIEIKTKTHTEIYNLDKFKSIEKTFQSYYSKKQKVDGLKKVFWYIFSIILIPIQFTIEIQNFFVRKIILSGKKLNSYNSLIITFEGDEFINIFLKDEKQYQEMKKYCLNRLGEDIEKIEKKYFIYFYIYNIIREGK
jgi:hypothetical protein